MRGRIIKTFDEYYSRLVTPNVMLLWKSKTQQEKGEKPHKIIYICNQVVSNIEIPNYKWTFELSMINQKTLSKLKKGKINEEKEEKEIKNNTKKYVFSCKTGKKKDFF